MTNPLKAFARAPKIYTKLPTLGRFYSQDFIYNVNGEVPIKGMTATDDLILNNPDALLNGDAVFSVLRSCVGECKDVKKLKIPDVETLLLGIRYASKGDNLKFITVCPHCKQEHGDKAKEREESISIRMLLDMSTSIDDLGEPSYHEYDIDENTSVRVNIMPSPYDNINRVNINQFEQARLVQFFQSNPDISREERNERMKESFAKLADLQLNILYDSIDSVDIIVKSENEPIVTKVTDKEHIKEYIHDLDKINADAINEKLAKLNKIGVPQELTVVCDDCTGEYKMEVKFDPANFFEDTF